MRAISDNELDKNIVGLVRAINEFKGIYTIRSCGGHPNNENFQNARRGMDGNISSRI